MVSSLGLRRIGVGIALAAGAAFVISDVVGGGSSSSSAASKASSVIGFGSSGHGYQAHVAAGDEPLRVHSQPSATASVLTTLQPGQSVLVRCASQGQSVSGDTTWYQVGENAWVTATFVEVAGRVPTC
jgi:hypothetical protein